MSAPVTASPERPTETDRAYMQLAELGARLRNLEQDLERVYRPALRRLLRKTSPARATS